MLCQVTLIGRLGRDPEQRQTQSGMTICNLNVACDHGYGEKKETFWGRVVCFSKTAEFCGQYLKKGDVVAVVGRLTERKWQDQSGQDRYVTEIIADRVQGVGGKAGADRPAQAKLPQAKPEDLDDEIPF